MTTVIHSVFGNLERRSTLNNRSGSPLEVALAVDAERRPTERIAGKWHSATSLTAHTLLSIEHLVLAEDVELSAEDDYKTKRQHAWAAAAAERPDIAPPQSQPRTALQNLECSTTPGVLVPRAALRPLRFRSAITPALFQERPLCRQQSLRWAFSRARWAVEARPKEGRVEAPK